MSLILISQYISLISVHQFSLVRPTVIRVVASILVVAVHTAEQFIIQSPKLLLTYAADHSV